MIRTTSGFAPHQKIPTIVNGDAKPPLPTEHQSINQPFNDPPQIQATKVHSATLEASLPSKMLAAIRSNQVPELERILKIKDLKNTKLSNGEMPLHYAIRSRSYDVVKFLLYTCQTDPFVKDHQGLTAFDHLFLTNDKKMIAIGLGASLGKTIPQSALAAPINGHEIQSLMQDLRDLRYPPVAALPPLHKAAFLGDIQELERLAKEKQDINHLNSLNRTPLFYAALGGKAEAVQWLLKKGAKTDGADAKGMGLLHMAAVGGSEAVLKALFRYKHDPNAKDAQGRTPLHLAFLLAADPHISSTKAAQYFASTRLLVERGADPLSQTMETRPLSVFQILTSIQSAQRNPLPFDTSSLFTFGLLSLSTICNSMQYNEVGKWLGILPVFTGILYKNKQVGVQSLLAWIGLTHGMQSYIDIQTGQSLYPGLRTAFLGKTWYDQMSLIWKNSAVESPLKLLGLGFLHTANALLSGWEFLETSGIRKQMVCQFGELGTCLDRTDLQPNPNKQPQCEKAKVFRLPNAAELEQSCKEHHPSLDPQTCQKRFWDERKAIRVACESQAIQDAKTIMSFGGHPQKTLEEARDALRKATLNDKVREAYQTLKSPPNSSEMPFPRGADCDNIPNISELILPAGVKLTDREKRIAVLNPACKKQAMMILDDCTEDPKTCKKNFRMMSLEFHPDKIKTRHKASPETKEFLDSRIYININEAYRTTNPK